jgi:hypothetical protein
MKARFALLLVITIVCPAFDDDSEKPLTIGEWGHVRFGPSPACSKIETTERALVLGFYQDTEALIKYVMPRYASPAHEGWTCPRWSVRAMSVLANSR